MWLKSLQEIVGTPTSIIYEDGCVKIVFTFQKTVELPEDAFPKETLKNILGRRIGIINIDGTYRIRNVKKPTK